MTPFKLFTCSDLDHNLKAAAANTFLLSEELPIEVKVDARQTMLLSKGRVSPKTGWVIVAPDDTLLLTVYEVVDFIRKNGLVQP